MPNEKKRSSPIDDDDRLSPEEERGLRYSMAQGDAGLTYGPFGKGWRSFEAFLKLTRQKRGVSLRLPAVLVDYLTTEAKRFGMTAPELMAVILQTHQFKNQDSQLIIMAVTRTSRKKPTKPKASGKK